MVLIGARSPYFISNEGFDENALLTVEIGYYDGGFTVSKSYTLNFRKQYELDISPLIRSEIKSRYTRSGATISKATDTEFLVYVKTTLSGSISEVVQSNIVNTFIASDGYSFYEEGYNYDLATKLQSNAYYAGSNNTIYKLDDDNLRIPILLPLDVADVYSYRVTYKNSGVEVYSLTGQTAGVTADYFINVGDSNIVDPLERIVADGGTIEASSCIDNFLREYLCENKLEDIDEVEIFVYDTTDTSVAFSKTLKVVTVEENKYTPYEIIFLNRFGVEESLWFFKKSEQRLNIERESYRGENSEAYKFGDLDNHTYRDYNINGKESMTLNTGFVDESFYENFKQLMMSEKAYIMIDAVKLPINIKGEELQKKMSVNEKLINYTIEIDYSYDKVNNIV